MPVSSWAAGAEGLISIGAWAYTRVAINQPSHIKATTGLAR